MRVGRFQRQCLVVIALATLLACAPADDPVPSVEDPAPPAVDPVAEDSSAESPRFALASLTGDRISTEDFGGRVVLIDFWATWCGPCHYQADILKKLHEEFADEDVQFLAVSLGEPEDVVRSFIEDNPYPYPVLVDPEDRLSPELGIYVLPTVMVLDRDGKVSYQQPGVSQAETLRRALYEAGVEHPATTG